MNIVDALSMRGGGRSFFEGAAATKENFERASSGQVLTPDTKTQDQATDEPVDIYDDSADTQPVDQKQPEVEQSEAETESTSGGQPAPAFDLESVRAELEADIGKKATKTLMDKVLRPLTEQVSGVAAQTAQVRVDRLVQKFGGVYPELKRGPALQAAIGVAQARQQKTGEADDKAMGWALSQIYGDRKAEMRAQVAGQLTSPTRSTGDNRKAPSTMDAARAAFKEYERLGGGQAGLQGAMALKKRLLGN